MSVPTLKLDYGWLWMWFWLDDRGDLPTSFFFFSFINLYRRCHRTIRNGREGGYEHGYIMFILLLFTCTAYKLLYLNDDTKIWRNYIMIMSMIDALSLNLFHFHRTSICLQLCAKLERTGNMRPYLTYFIRNNIIVRQYYQFLYRRYDTSSCMLCQIRCYDNNYKPLRA